MDQLKKPKAALLADYLLERKDDILQNWASEVMENNEETTAIAALSKKEFYNSIPDSIHNFCKQLRNEEVSIEDFSRAHGSQRWEYGIKLKLLTEEWSDLYFILMEEINRAHEVLNLSLDSLKSTQRKLSEYILHALQNSVEQYYRLDTQQAEAQLGALEQSLLKGADLMKKKGQNLQSASHDIGGSMAVLDLNLSLLKQTKLNKDARELVDQISMAADNLSQLLNNLISLFRLEAGREKRNVKEFDAAEILQKMAKTMESVAREKNLELRIEGEGELKVKGDMLKVKRIAQNLLLNSLKYTEEGYVKITWKLYTEDNWLLEIQDTGPGIGATNAALFTNTKENIEHYRPDVNQMEDTTDNPDEVRMHSEGIGLLIVRELCGLLDAVVHMESNNSGTHFQIVFPVDYKNE